MALIHHYTRGVDGTKKRCDIDKYNSPAEFVVAIIPNGTPFRCYKNDIDITNDINKMVLDGEFKIVEYAGGGVVNAILRPINKILSWFMPSQSSASQANVQAASANNSLTDRTNKPRPYERIYDICGTVTCYPSDLMQAYRLHDSSNKEYEYGYYYVGRGHLQINEDDVFDGDTPLNTVTGSAASFYNPQSSPNSGSPFLNIGGSITENLYTTIKSNSIDGIVLKAPNEFIASLKDLSVTCELSGTTGTLINASGDAGFDDLFAVGDSVTIENVKTTYSYDVQTVDPVTGNIITTTVVVTAVLNGSYTVLAVESTYVALNVSNKLTQWQKIENGSDAMIANDDAIVRPTDIVEAGFTDWVSITTIEPKRLVANVVARQGMYKTKDNSKLYRKSATAQLQWQALDDNLNPTGAIYSVDKTLTDRSRDEVGMSIIADLPSQTKVRVRLRRSDNQDTGYEGTIYDELTYRDLYGQIPDSTAYYGDMTTVHTKRKATVQAAAIKEPQLKVICTELLHKYLGNGVFDSVRTTNTQAVQSLIRLMRDPYVGGLTLTNSCMDGLLEVQDEIETYFNNPVAGQFCYTFDDKSDTAQDICQTIAEAVFSTVYRDGNDIKLHFERPVSGPSMVFTHRSKVGAEKWTRSYGSQSYDSLEFKYVDPDTNTTETIKIPEAGGANPHTIDSKGVRNYQQAYWLAHRQRQKDILQRVSVEFTSTEEGLYAVVGEPISVVKGSRVAAYDGYVVAQSGLTLTLSQEVKFTNEDDHFIQLKRRDGTVESIRCESGNNARTVTLLSAPSEEVYTGNSAVKTEFSFGNEARHLAQMIIPVTVDPQSNKTVKITGKNYREDIFKYDGVDPVSGGFSDGFSDGFDI